MPEVEARAAAQIPGQVEDVGGRDGLGIFQEQGVRIAAGPGPGGQEFLQVPAVRRWVEHEPPGVEMRDFVEQSGYGLGDCVATEPPGQVQGQVGMMEVSGVRRSWETVDRNRDLSRSSSWRRTLAVSS